MTILEDQYFEWLKPQVYSRDGTVKQYEGMLRLLYDREFVWSVPNDDNRLEDAHEVRREFMGNRSRVFYKPISVLEVLIAISRRMEWIRDREARAWAWELIRNLGLNKMYDPLTSGKEDKIDGILETLIWRTYERSGKGGFFPLKNAKQDQTKVELWYQMHAYFAEIHEP